ncbi:adenosylcobinamide-phosphate synthase CbiB [Flammeovirga kamogawensis]|uniref:Cobalamin biosynthesis protein CobD n=1 Tax=Flammeovirga kamogawensis TaxID=373891 RepID=A0ABX8H3K3_9BACT|nr:adenosylcobinamide-phosphate synthase CbiB [Flammeovirga kamogawensis]MBB6460333.1 adenosylcobinamide-phosphate synthase [Flammeovirga kamogawensis]QWG10142.1 adenosylcobinamide-phosphate synthase CbiB [Flammeovirga kamogawensis]TRX65650.1 cobalamin biosynthesis protein CobD [Flammeovirga kamogawensis]
MELEHIAILLFAYCLDLILGDPRQLPHLIVLFGNSISWGEKRLNKADHLFEKGLLLTLTLVVLSFVIPYIALLQLSNYSIFATVVISIVLLFYCLANKTLVKEGVAVFTTLENQGLEAGRKRLSWIVGRDTSSLNENQIRIATLETMSENLSDGVIAPLFFFAISGVPGAMAYKMINTLDSMVGYKNTRYEQFGKFAAKLDDVANYLPSRITAFLILLFSNKLKGLKFVFTEGKKHSSPNAGYPEAALAFVLNCRFGGPNIYFGKIVEKPYIGTNERNILHTEIYKTAKINYGVSLIMVVFCVAYLLLIKNI